MFDKALRESQLSAELALASSHLAGVRFVVVAGEMKQAVQDEDFDFRRERVALIDGLLARSGNGDSQVASDFFCGYFLHGAFSGKRAFSRKREHVGGFILVAELAVEFTEVRVGGEQDGDLAAEADGLLRQSEKAGQGTGGRQAEIFLWGGRPLRRSCLRHGVGFQVWVDEDHRARWRGVRGSGCSHSTRDRRIPPSM